MNTKIHTSKKEIALGVSGHRWIMETPELLDAVDEVIQRIHHVYSISILKVISPLAEGADRIVAKQSLDLPNACLVALLPFPEKEYLKDFSTLESVKEFQELYHQAKQTIELPGSSDREEAYLALGKTLLDHCEILITIWDGRPANGRGGTAEIVQEARKRGLPVAWIHVEKPKVAERDLALPKEDHVKVVFERFPSPTSPGNPEKESEIT